MTKIAGLPSMVAAVAISSLAVAAQAGSVPSPSLGEIVKAMVADNVPLSAEERKGWGDQVRVFDGLHFSGQGFKVKAEVRKKSVNHGLWQYYRVWVEDACRDLSVEFPRLEYVEHEGIRFAVVLRAHLHAYGDVKQYSNGLKLFSGATEAEFDVTVRVEGLIGVAIVPKGLQSELRLTPQVESVGIDLPNIDVERFGRIKGDVAREMGDKFRKILERRLQHEEPDVKSKVNRAIQKRLDDGSLTLTLQDLVRTKKP